MMNTKDVHVVTFIGSIPVVKEFIDNLVTHANHIFLCQKDTTTILSVIK